MRLCRPRGPAPRSHPADFGVTMRDRNRRLEGVTVSQHIQPAAALLAALLTAGAVLAPAPASAQVNIDQDKTPAHIYASDCSVCHKSIRGLANGQGRPGLTAFLAEHYTSSESEAAALAAYVL